MRLTALSLVLAATLLVALSARQASAAVTAPHAPATAAAQQQTPQPIPKNDDSRVGVQVGVLCAAVAVVVVAGGCGYFLRKRLGLGGPPPQQDAGGHH